AWAPAPEVAPAPAPPARAAPPAGGAAPVRKMRGWVVVAVSVGGVALLVALLVLVLLPPLNRAREQARRVQCAANMRELGQAMFVYASSNAGQFPDTLDKVLPFAGAG